MLYSISIAHAAAAAANKFKYESEQQKRFDFIHLHTRICSTTLDNTTQINDSIHLCTGDPVHLCHNYNGNEKNGIFKENSFISIKFELKSVELRISQYLCHILETHRRSNRVEFVLISQLRNLFRHIRWHCYERVSIVEHLIRVIHLCQAIVEMLHAFSI